MRYSLIIATVLATTCYSCSNVTTKEQEITKKELVVPYSDMEGYWLQEGYGVYLVVSDSLYKMYDITEISCQPSVSGSLNNWTDSLSTLLDLYSLEEFNSRSMILKYGITAYRFNRLEQPLAICENPILASDDPELNFDVLWYTFKENYAYSEVRKVDWDQIYSDIRPIISKHTTAVQLYGYIKNILDSIQDQHISFRVPKNISEAYLEMQEKSNKDTNVKNEKEEAIEHKEYDYPSLRSEAIESIPILYNQNNFKRYHKDLLIWGNLQENLGYIQINGMNGYTLDVNVPDSLSSQAYWQEHWAQIFREIEMGRTLGQYLRGELAGVNVMMDSVLSELPNNIIIDLRFNPGGTDQVALDILSNFTNKSTKLFTKKIWIGHSDSFESDVYVHPSKKIYAGKVALLTGPQTGSSAETMVLGSLKLPNIIRVGSSTMGIFSDVLQKKLPNGWRFGLSNEIYETEGKENYEYKGIPPDFEVKYSKDWISFYKLFTELKEADPAIERAISILNNQ